MTIAKTQNNKQRKNSKNKKKQRRRELAPDIDRQDIGLFYKFRHYVCVEFTFTYQMTSILRYDIVNRLCTGNL